MSTIRNPVGPQPPAVYWRRRLLLALGILAVIIVIVLIVTRPGAATPTGSKTPKPSTGASDTPNPNPSFSSTAGADAAACDPASVQVVAVTDHGSYAADAQPQVSMKITNIGATPCSYDVGTDAQEYIITSGNDRIWSSKDCQTEPTPLVQVLQPGAPLTTTPFAWDRTRSSTSTCTTTRPAVVAGGASYHLGVKLGTSESVETVQFVLN
ncbi:hypothetical protein BH11ACT3_BH11ACT3_16830 [soil metagenome]